MKIVVLGAGAMGCLYGGHLAEAGNEVWLLDIWKEHIDQINERGLFIEGISGNRTIKNIKGITLAKDVGFADLVIVFVKSTLTHKAIEECKDVLGPSTLVLTLQNGLGNIEKLESVVEKNNIIAGITAHGATVVGPGHIKHAGKGDTLIGELNGSISERIQLIDNTLNLGGIHTKVSSNVLGLIWGKLLVNVGINALTAITRLRNGELIKYSEIEELLELSVAEAQDVAKAKGIVLEYSDPITHTKEVCKATAENISSMLQDVLNKRKTEIDMINGAIVKEGERLGIPTPVNKTLAGLVRFFEKQ